MSVRKMGAAACACLVTFLAASPASAGRSGTVALGTPVIEYVAPKQAYVPPKPPASLTLDDLLAKARQSLSTPADLPRFARHDGYKLVVDKGANKLYLFRGNTPLHAFSITRSTQDGDKRRHGDMRTPEGLFSTTSVGRETSKGFLVWIELDTARRARADYLREFGATGKAHLAAFERRHGAITANSHVSGFNSFARSRRAPFMWSGVGMHGVLGEGETTAGCVGLAPRDALFVHDTLRKAPKQGRDVPVLMFHPR